MKRRITIVLLAACLLLAIVPGVLAAKDQTPNTSWRAGETGADITRAEWISDLVSTFSMTIEDANAPDNYYTDLTGEESYYRDIMIATEFGLIDIEAGLPFRPEDPATREFAAQTLNFCLGYQLDDDVEYSFSDVEALTYPNDAQVAINRAWFALSDGEFLPNQPITSAEKEFMLKDVAAIQANMELDPEHENSVRVADSVIVVPQTTIVEEGDEGFLKIYDIALPIQKDSIFVVYYSDLPLAFKAISVEKKSNYLLIETTTEGTDDAFDELDFQGELSGNSTKGDTRGTSRINDISKNLTFDVISGLKCTVTGELKNITLESKINKTTGEYQVVMRGNATLDVSAKGSVATAAGNKTITLVSAPILYGAGKIGLYFEYDFTGEVHAVWNGQVCAGYSFSPKDGFRIIKSFNKRSFTSSAEVTFTAGLRFEVSANFVVADGKAWASVGL